MSDKDELTKAIAELRTLSETFQKDASHLQARGDSCGAKRLLECAGLFCAVCSAAEQAQTERERADSALGRLVKENAARVTAELDNAALKRELAEAVEIIRGCVDRRLNHEMGELTRAMNFLARHQEPLEFEEIEAPSVMCVGLPPRDDEKPPCVFCGGRGSVVGDDLVLAPCPICYPEPQS